MDTHFDAKHTFKLGENKAWMRNNSSQILKKKHTHTTESIKNSINRMLFEMASPK